MIKLDRLVTVLGSYGARLATAAEAPGAELRSVAMHDPTAPGPTVGDAFLAVGVPSLREAVDLAVGARAAVLLARTGDEPERDVLATARDHGLAVVLLDRGTPWNQVAAVVYGLVLEGRETESGRGPSDLFALADTIAAAVGGPVTIEDPLSRVVAYSSLQQDADPARLDTILGRRVPDQVRALFDERGVFSHLAASDEPLYVPSVPELGLRGRTVAAVRAGKELLGSVWVTCAAPLEAARTRVLAEGAHTIALHLLRSRVSADLERQVESELVIQLLEGTPDATAVLAKLGLPPRQLRVIALQAHAPDERNAAILLAFERATTGFGWSRPGRSTLFGNTVYTVLPCDDDVAPAHRWLRDLDRALPGHVTISAGIGGAATPGDIPASRQEADESLALHSGRPAGPAVSYDEAWDEILLQRLRTAASAGRLPSRGPIAELARHDRDHATGYLPTLRAWLEGQGDLNAAAAGLGVHPNTIRYRLRKMTEVAHLQLDDPRKRLAMLITLAIQEQEGA
ncbi:PucR family transcriptional regulator [Prauserella muralis]|uniref:PucR family transcriptional regulator n=1 Tax=Prauserella muralis TaxID=588067 RepID=A0A2V4BE60_9PSEU|nr:helix-turn-helix domain-containing protein [Prauserella muralis]PXY27909.1 PucR family transcriptional regulator [Prauserella muralis]TWE22310.1 PucR-like helix-turn-helix protein [Prauserella muralis]